MISACHGRVGQCATLRRLVPGEQGADQEARTAATNVMRYFDTAAKQHHADEEEDFPALIESMAGSDAVCLREMIEHEGGSPGTGAAWECLRRILERIVAANPCRLPRCRGAGRSARTPLSARKRAVADGGTAIKK
jgi:hypothetical protein